MKRIFAIAALCVVTLTACNSTPQRSSNNGQNAEVAFTKKYTYSDSLKAERIGGTFIFKRVDVLRALTKNAMYYSKIIGKEKSEQLKNKYARLLESNYQSEEVIELEISNDKLFDTYFPTLENKVKKTDYFNVKKPWSPGSGPRLESYSLTAIPPVVGRSRISESTEIWHIEKEIPITYRMHSNLGFKSQGGLTTSATVEIKITAKANSPSYSKATLSFSIDTVDVKHPSVDGDTFAEVKFYADRFIEDLNTSEEYVLEKEIANPSYSKLLLDASMEFERTKIEVVQAKDIKRRELEHREKAQQRKIALEKKAVEQKLAAKREAIRKKQFIADVKRFRLKLSEGQHSHCGLVVEVKSKIARIESIAGLKYLRVDQLYPAGSVQCIFRNGMYQAPVNLGI